jgi:DNA-binding HxlR family transcriptional regulator
VSLHLGAMHAAFQAGTKRWGRHFLVPLVEAKRLFFFELMETPSAHQMVESIIGCKWSLTVLGLVRKGVRRPGEMEHAIEGLSGKVLNERLAKLVRFGILEKQTFAEVPPRVEYRLTPFGGRFIRVIDEVEALQRTL